MINRHSFEKPWLMVMAIALLATGLVVDLAFTQPRISKLQALQQKQGEIHADLSRALQARQDNENLLRFMEEQGISLSAPDKDPASFLGEKVESSSLTRLELRATESASNGNLRRSQFFLRLLGKFGPTLDFIRSLEQDSRLVVVDAIRMEPSGSDSKLETRLNLSIYDPRGGN